MRIKQLDLLRYGHFTDAVISLPAAKPDMHLLLGENEAGKSTTMAAVEDLLFGIPPNSPRNFLHEYGAMRVGASLEKGSETLKIRRRKGIKDTLLAENDLPIPSGEGALAPFLAGADRGFYTRMFSLDHQRLRDGGKEILQAQGDVGEMLFSASAGIIGLRETLKAMEKEADSLWSSRRAAHRKYFQAEERLDSADASMREHLVTTSQWQLLRSALETSNSAYDAIEQEIEIKSVELRKLARIRRVYRDIRKRAEAEAKILALGTVVAFDAEALRVLEQAARNEAEAAARVATLNEQVASLEAERAALIFDAALLERCDDIQQLHDRRIQIRAGKIDLPKRRAELAVAEADLRRLAGELEWAGDISELAARIPTKSKIAGLRALLNRRGEQSGAVDNAKAALAEAEEKSAEIAMQIAALGPVKDVSKLAAVIKATRERGDIGGQITNSKREEQEALAAIDRGLMGLRPAVTGPDLLESMPVPPLAAVEMHRNACRNMEQRHQTCRERIRSAEQDLARHKKAYERVISDEHVIAPGELERLRHHRDAGWSIIKRRHIDGFVVSEAEVEAFAAADTLAEVYEGAIRDADKAADQRFEKSEAAARLAVIARQISEQRELLDGLTGEEKGLAEERATLAAAWAILWTGCPLTPADPDAMIEWLHARSAIIGQMTRLATAGRNTTAWQERETDAKGLIQTELDTLGNKFAIPVDQPLHVVIESAAAIERTHEGNAKARRDLDAAERKAATAVARKRRDLENAKSQFEVWAGEWDAALTALQFPATATPDTVEAQINAIDEMREAANRISDLRHERIEKIERDIDAFEADVAALLQMVAPQLKTDAETAVLDLQRMAAEAARICDLKDQKDVVLAGLRKKIAACHDASSEACEIISRFQRHAGVTSIDDLRIAIRRSDELRLLQATFDQLTDTLTKDGDGLSIADLTAECAAIDLDAIAARDDTVTQEVDDLRDSLMEARETRNEARRAFDAIGGDDRAATAAADRQAALAEMTEVAEQYVRLRSAILLLQWSIDHYRREKQAPMLKRASELFAILSCGSFETLQLEFDEHDNVQLAGIKQDGKRVPVSGMSTGTADQLYLALRVAAIEDYLDHAAPLPFIADDLFINFDEKRAAAGFRVLNELAKKTQVLFFTHHEHLVDVARETLDGAVSAVILPVATSSPSPRSEAA